MRIFMIMVFIPALSLGFVQHVQAQPSRSSNKMEKQIAVFAGGCFWCMEPPFDKVDGVLETIVGYAGGHVPNPSYKEVSAGETGHVEAVKVIFDPSKISYVRLLDVFWRNIDPTAVNRQFNDIGYQYRTVIYYLDEQQQRLAEETKDQLKDSGRFKKPIATEVLPFKNFYPAEDYHQEYYKKHPFQYKFYRAASGRDRYLKKTWPDSH